MTDQHTLVDKNETLYIPADIIKQAAFDAGFHDCGIAAVREMNLFNKVLNQWLADGCHADMEYMRTNADKRCQPTMVFEEARSIVSVALGYKPKARIEGRRKIALYAYGEDYHKVIKRRLYTMIATLKKQYPTFEARPCVDTVPISDKRWAVEAGIGWQGRNTLVVSPRLGTYFNIGELLCNATSEYSQVATFGCGDCQRCVEACPNKALKTITIETKNGMHNVAQLDARLCASYHSIENRATIPSNIKLSGFAFGCDICQSVCPYNIHSEPSLNIDEETIERIKALQEGDEKAFRRHARHSAMERIKLHQWLRNCKHEY